jgi:hypothetical protein
MIKPFPWESPFGDEDALATDTLWPNGGDTVIFGGADLPPSAGAPVVTPAFVDEAQFDVSAGSSGPAALVTPAEADHAPASATAGATSVVVQNSPSPAHGIEGPPAPPQDSSGVTPSGTVAVAQSSPAAAEPQAFAASTADPAFVFHKDFGQVVITNFTPGTSVIQFDKDVFTDFADVQSHLVQAGADAAISHDYADFIIIKNVSPASLHASDFLFT